MARQYSPRSFFRHAPNNLLAQYFKEKGVLGEINFQEVTETKIDSVYEAWLALPDSERNRMDAEFQDIFEMSCEKGFRAIIDEATWQMQGTPDEFQTLVEKLSSLENHYERAMITFLDHNNFWRGATLFYHADTLSNWRKRKNLPHKPAAVDEASLLQLAALIRHYFHYKEGRGKNCTVEAFRRGELDYFFAYPEDYSQQNIEWVNGEFGRRPHNPAFEVIYVYSQKEGSLDLSFRGSYKAIEPLQGMFAEVILKIPELPPDPKDERVYDLSPLLQRSFDFTYDVGSGIEEVAVKKMRLSSQIKKGDRITLEADPSQDYDAVYDLLDQIGRAIPLNMYNLTQAELSASVVVDSNKPAKQISFRVTHPNSCSLKYDELGLKLRNMLALSGIEPKEPVKSNKGKKLVVMYEGD